MENAFRYNIKRELGVLLQFLEDQAIMFHHLFLKTDLNANRRYLITIKIHRL